ncbi:unnamed protein product [Commensalibacter communis]|uniref:Arc-like DNA binding domain-containing protein n=1 Tax=Commensalibacter communis TaxID=2972786 RepID=A0A9W4TQR3_9PROT|nr:unnamed protein product [Commensalibacter communis]CAI3945005.1 unnamed protein product [Commensalibacter communis]CAI3959189.1 unnamed protein product [Commensalibacter communis]CAI3960883.1 unnamed protein product [Commensalibacter communis]
MEKRKSQIIVRIPLELREWITMEANKNCRSANMQIVYFLNQIKNSELGNGLNDSITK